MITPESPTSALGIIASPAPSAPINQLAPASTTARGANVQDRRRRWTATVMLTRASRVTTNAPAPADMNQDVVVSTTTIRATPRTGAAGSSTSRWACLQCTIIAYPRNRTIQKNVSGSRINSAISALPHATPEKRSGEDECGDEGADRQRKRGRGHQRGREHDHHDRGHQTAQPRDASQVEGLKGLKHKHRWPSDGHYREVLTGERVASRPQRLGMRPRSPRCPFVPQCPH